MCIEHFPGMVGIRCDVCRRRDLYRTGAEMRSASARDIRRAAKRDGWWRRKQRYGLRSTVLETGDWRLTTQPTSTCARSAIDNTG
jgi:hypothetical protein